MNRDNYFQFLVGISSFKTSDEATQKIFIEGGMAVVNKLAADKSATGEWIRLQEMHELADLRVRNQELHMLLKEEVAIRSGLSKQTVIYRKRIEKERYDLKISFARFHVLAAYINRLFDKGILPENTNKILEEHGYGAEVKDGEGGQTKNSSEAILPR